MSKKIAEALEAIKENIAIIEEEISVPAPSAKTASKQAPVAASKTSKVATKASSVVEQKVVAMKSKKAVVKEEEPEVTRTLDEADLKKMGYNDLKKLAASMGISAIGDKQKIIAAILDTQVSAGGEDDDSSDEGGEDAPTLQDKVEAAVADMSDKDIIDYLASIDVKVIGKPKRQALIAKVVKAAEEGKVDLDDEEGNDDSNDTDETSGEESIFDVYSDARRETCDSIEAEARSMIKTGKLKEKDIVEAITEFYLEDELEKPINELSKNEKIELYVSMLMKLVDDEGESHDFGEAYYINGELVCCGKQPELDEDGNAVCPLCGNAYEVEG